MYTFPDSVSAIPGVRKKHLRNTRKTFCAFICIYLPLIYPQSISWVMYVHRLYTLYTPIHINPQKHKHRIGVLYST